MNTWTLCMSGKQPVRDCVQQPVVLCGWHRWMVALKFALLYSGAANPQCRQSQQRIERDRDHGVRELLVKQ